MSNRKQLKSYQRDVSPLFLAAPILYFHYFDYFHYFWMCVCVFVCLFLTHPTPHPTPHPPVKRHRCHSAAISFHAGNRWKPMETGGNRSESANTHTHTHTHSGHLCCIVCQLEHSSSLTLTGWRKGRGGGEGMDDVIDSENRKTNGNVWGGSRNLTGGAICASGRWVELTHTLTHTDTHTGLFSTSVIRAPKLSFI